MTGTPTTTGPVRQLPSNTDVSSPDETPPSQNGSGGRSRRASRASRGTSDLHDFDLSDVIDQMQIGDTYANQNSWRNQATADGSPADAAFSNSGLSGAGADARETDLDGAKPEALHQGDLKPTETRSDHSPDAFAGPDNSAPRPRLFSRDFATPLSASPNEENETSVKDVGLRPASDRETRPFKELDWVDRHYIWMQENPIKAFLLATPLTLFGGFGIGLFMSIRAHARHGRGYDKQFAQENAPGLYFQEKQSDRSQSLRHAVSAALGGPIDITKSQFNSWRRTYKPDYGFQGSWAIAKALLPEAGCEKSCVTYNWELSEDRNSFDEELGAAQEGLQHENANFAIVGVETRGASGRARKDWVTFRKDPDASDPDKAWTLVDASRFIIDGKNGHQPQISPSQYLSQKLDRGDLTGFTIICPSAVGEAAGVDGRSAGQARISDAARLQNTVIEDEDDTISAGYGSESQRGVAPGPVDEFEVSAPEQNPQQHAFQSAIVNMLGGLARTNDASAKAIKDYTTKHEDTINKYDALKLLAYEHSGHRDSLRRFASALLRGCKPETDMTKEITFQYLIAAHEQMKQLAQTLQEKHTAIVEVLRRDTRGVEMDAKKRSAVDKENKIAAEQLQCVWDMKLAVERDVEAFQKVLDGIETMPSFGQPHDR